MRDGTMDVKLRELSEVFDEHGIKYRSSNTALHFEDSRGYDCSAWEVMLSRKRGKLLVISHSTTPEEAVDFIVGPKTCHAVGMDCFGNPPYNQTGLNGNDPAIGCSECGAPWSTCGLFRGTQMSHNFVACPICGRRIVE